MICIALSEKDTATDTLEKRRWAAADQFRANSGLCDFDFLRIAEVRFGKQCATLEEASAWSRCGSRVDEPSANHPYGILNFLVGKCAMQQSRK